MRRDLDAARQAARALTQDLSRTLAGVWEVELTDDYVLTVSHDDLTEQVALDQSVDVDAWPEEMLLPGSEELQEVLYSDAAEAVAYDVIEVVQMWGQDWPVCAVHGAELDPCEGVWVCLSDIEHDVVFGELGK